jgi:hypothetical protein
VGRRRGDRGMSTMLAIITRAIRMTRARALGDDPSGEEADAALEDAQAMFLTTPTRRLVDVLITEDYEAGENERISYTSGAWTVTYPTTIEDDDGTTRLPQNGAIVEVSAAAGSTRKIYISELKTWMTLTGLTLASEQPFGPTHDLDVAAMIAARIAGSVVQRSPPDEVLALANQGRGNIRNAFRQTYTPTFDRALLRPEDLNVDA